MKIRSMLSVLLVFLMPVITKASDHEDPFEGISGVEPIRQKMLELYEQDKDGFIAHVENSKNVEDFNKDAPIHLDLNEMRLGFSEGEVFESELNRKTFSYNLGTHNMPNVHRFCWKHVVDTRHHKIKVWMEFSHPSIDDMRIDVINCTISALTVGAMAAILSENIDLGMKLFYPAWKLCMITKVGKRAKEISIDIKTDNQYTCWSHHC